MPKEVPSKVVNDVSVSEVKLQGTRISAKRRVPTTGRTSGTEIRAHDFLLHRMFALQKLGACEV
ncbi:MAG: hypothetical protein MUO88_06695 [Desulfobacterales bacterium]|nr:hypothetical protein [Desulfobacterales bacterium]